MGELSMLAVGSAFEWDIFIINGLLPVYSSVDQLQMAWEGS